MKWLVSYVAGGSTTVEASDLVIPTHEGGSYMFRDSRRQVIAAIPVGMIKSALPVDDDTEGGA